MDDGIKKFLTKSLWVGAVVFVVRYLVCSFNDLYGFISATSETIVVTLIIMGFYSRFLWKFISFEKTPRLLGKYKGHIKYEYDGKKGKKIISIEIKQTLFTVKIKIVTNEITSHTIIGNLIIENDEYVLYYNYITNPKSEFSEKNPIQYGTCRLVVEDNDNLKGTYWTSRRTIGDIEMRKIKQ